MPAKIKKRFTALLLTEKVKPRFFKIIKATIKSKIIDFLEKGISPVNQRTAKIKNTGGKNRFVQYSDSYKGAIDKKQVGDSKRKRPINLKVTGKLHRSIKVRKNKDSVSVWFTDEKAKYHDRLGAGKSKIIRRLLPKTGERWATNIEKLITSALEKAIRLSK
tara:strand:- start:25 stop:510 length:486 start_codon:yes stop_codon:yes gene_type:complete